MWLFRFEMVAWSRVIRMDPKKWVKLRDIPDRACVDLGDEAWRFLVGQLGQGEHG